MGCTAARLGRLLLGLSFAACVACTPRDAPVTAAQAQDAHAAHTPIPGDDDVALASMGSDDGASEADAGGDASDTPPPTSVDGDEGEDGDDGDDDDDVDDDYRARLRSCKSSLLKLRSMRQGLRGHTAWRALAQTPAWQALRADAQAYGPCRFVRQPGSACAPLRQKLASDRAAVQSSEAFGPVRELASWQSLRSQARRVAEAGCFAVAPGILKSR